MPDLVAWLDRLHWMTAVVADVDACRRIAREDVEDAKRDGLDYVELRFSPDFQSRPRDLDPAAVVEAIVAGTAGAEAARSSSLLPGELEFDAARQPGAAPCRP